MKTPLETFLADRYEEEILWAIEASRPKHADPPPVGAVWHWVDPENDESVTLRPGMEEFVGEAKDVSCVSLRSVQEWRSKTITSFTLPQFALHSVEEVPVMVGLHMVRYCPSRVIADIRAKQVIAKLHASSGHACSVLDETGYHLNYDDVAPGEDCTTLKMLAEPYVDHPKYDQAWRVQWT